MKTNNTSKKKIEDIKTKKKIFYIEASPYDCGVLVVVNGTFKDAYNKLKRSKSPNAIKNVKYIDSHKDAYFEQRAISVTGSVYTELPFGFVMVLKVQNCWLDTVSVASHECLHLTHYILERAGIELVRESEEAYTYLQADLLRKVLDKIY